MLPCFDPSAQRLDLVGAVDAPQLADVLYDDDFEGGQHLARDEPIPSVTLPSLLRVLSQAASTSPAPRPRLAQRGDLEAVTNAIAPHVEIVDDAIAVIVDTIADLGRALARSLPSRSSARGGGGGAGFT